MRHFQMAVLLTVLLGACQHRAAVPERIDGLYFADGGFAGTDSMPKLLLLEQGLFELLNGTELLQRGTFELRDGVLRLKPIGGGTRAGLETTYAVVEGRLLLGVLRPVGGERHRWTSIALPSEFLGHEKMARVQPESFRIDWDLREGEWRFTSGARQVVLTGVSRLEGDPAQEGRSFVPVFRRPAQRGGGDDPASMIAEKKYDVVLLPEGELSRFGLEAAPKAPLRILSGQARSHVYERRGAVVVTPWTVDLGPVGLLPVRADPSTLAGTYVSGDEELVVFSQPPPRDPQRSEYDHVFYHPGDEQKCLYAPDARGLVAWTLGMRHPPMSHWDKPERVFCFALADGRVVRYISSAGCSGASPATLDVFQRDL